MILDVGRGQTNISFEVAIKSMTQGVLPTTISSDVYLPTLHGPVYGLTVTMSEFIALGLSLSQVIEMTTINPANVLKIEDRKGSLQPGMDADISILELLSGHWKGEDFQQNSIEMTTLIEPVMTIKSGRIIPAQPVSRPQPID